MIIKAFVRSRFVLTSRKQVIKQTLRSLDEYKALSEALTDKQGALPVTVPKMIGVDEDMRTWSFFELLEHNLIVNRRITESVLSLANDSSLSLDDGFDPKKDVMPTNDLGEKGVAAFFDSIDKHINQVERLGKLRGTSTSKHPLFGFFDAHKWNCMLAFHLQVHLPQARYIAKEAKKQSLH